MHDEVDRAVARRERLANVDVAEEALGDPLDPAAVEVVDLQRAAFVVADHDRLGRSADRPRSPDRPRRRRCGHRVGLDRRGRVADRLWGAAAGGPQPPERSRMSRRQ